MEQSKRGKMLLVAFILGVCWFVISVLWFIEAKPINLQNVDWDWDWGRMLAQFKEAGVILTIFFTYTVILPILLVPTILLNIFGWLKNDAKKTHLAAILYLLGLNIPSAVLCFIGFRKLKKQSAQVQEAQ